MRETRTCPKCHSTEVIEQVRVVDRAEGGTRDLSLSFPGPSVAGLFRVPQHVPLSAWVCARCGYTELYATQPEQVRASRDRMAAEISPTTWGQPVVAGDQGTNLRRIAFVALAVALAMGAGLLVVALLLFTTAK